MTNLRTNRHPDAVRLLVNRGIVSTIASVGFVACFLMNLATFFHFNSLNQYFSEALFWGVFVAWIGTIPAWRRLGFGPRQIQSAPDEVRHPLLLLVGYMIFTIITVVVAASKEGAKLENINGRWSLPLPAEYSTRVFTAALMLFYGFVVATQRFDRLERERNGRTPAQFPED